VARRGFGLRLRGCRPSALINEGALKHSLEAIAFDLALAGKGGRNRRAYSASFRFGKEIARGGFSRAQAERMLQDACQRNGLVADDGARSVLATIASGLNDGQQAPRDSPVPRAALSQRCPVARPPLRAEEADAERAKVLRLWRRREPLEGTVAERYLREARRYSGPLPVTLGFLPQSGRHPPALIAAFGMALEPEPGVLEMPDSLVRAVQLTRLLPDGSDRLRDAKAKRLMTLAD
jgi:hypothetical protein